MPSYECRGKNKLWSVRFDIIENGLPVTKRLSGFQTKRETQQAYHDFIDKMRTTKLDANDKIRFENLYYDYLSFTKNRIKESSFYDFCSKSELHILPYFKDYSVKNITPKMLLEWQDSLSRYSYKYKTNLRGYLSSILKYAEKYYQIPNQLKNVETFRDSTDEIKEMQIYTPEEFNTFISNVENIVYKAFFTALYYTGARKGEILATTWKDWDLNKGLLKINKTLTKKVYDKPYAITKPKNTTSIRIISIPQRLINIMSELKRINSKGLFVFFDNKPLADSSITRVQKEVCEKCGIKVIRLHDFRHSHASLLISQGISIMAVAKRLGHKNTQQTLNTYAHMLPTEETKLVNLLDSI